MTILPNGVAVIDGDTHHAVWCAQQGLIHDRWFADICCRHVRKGGVAIDGGANIGTLTRAMLDAGAIVYAFEPNREAVQCLGYNCPEAISFNVALGESEARASLTRSSNAGASYIAQSDDGDVWVSRIDDFNLSPTLLKLDIEGYETMAIRGALKTITRSRPAIVMEVNSPALKRCETSANELLTLVASLGYSWTILQPQCKYGDECFDVECLPIPR